MIRLVKRKYLDQLRQDVAYSDAVAKQSLVTVKDLQENLTKTESERDQYKGLAGKAVGYLIANILASGRKARVLSAKQLEYAAGYLMQTVPEKDGSVTVRLLPRAIPAKAIPPKEKADG